MDTDDREEISSVPPGAGRRSSNLIALATAAVLTVYAAGYARTKEAADRFDVADAERRVPDVIPSGARTPAATTTGRGAQPAPQPKPDAKQPTRPIDSVPAPAPVTTAVVAAPAKTEPLVTKAPPSVSLTALLPKDPEPITPMVPQTTPPAAPPAATPAALAQQQPPKLKWNDGTYSGWGTSRHGDIQASVQIKDGEIVNAWISQCLTNYSCSWIDRLPPQVITRQSAEVDYVSGATQSVNAFYYAILGALRAAK